MTQYSGAGLEDDVSACHKHQLFQLRIVIHIIFFKLVKESHGDRENQRLVNKRIPTSVVLVRFSSKAPPQKLASKHA